jgi:hypothetical protein
MAHRQRHTIAETDAVARALDDAAKRWPQNRDDPARLLVRLIREGHTAIRTPRELGAADRHRALQQTAGALTGAYDVGYLGHLRRDWPA